MSVNYKYKGRGLTNRDGYKIPKGDSTNNKGFVERNGFMEGDI